MDPHAIRQRIREGRWDRPSRGLAPGYVQAGLVVVDSADADEFEAFCEANVAPCPIVEALPRGSAVSAVAAPGADIRTDLARYHIVRGQSAVVSNSLADYWHDHLRAFLIGCSYTFEGVLQRAGIRIKGQGAGVGNPLFRTRVTTTRVGRFGGPLVVSMRVFARRDIEEVVNLTKGLVLGHGAPVHVGDPAALGIDDIREPDWGRPVEVDDGEVAAFWACSVTASESLKEAGVASYATQLPSYTFVTDLQV